MKVYLLIMVASVLVACASSPEVRKSSTAPDPMAFYKLVDIVKTSLDSGNDAARPEYVKLVLKRPELANSSMLFLGAAYALDEGRLEDGAFMYFAAQMRATLDLKRYSSQLGGASAALSSISQTLGGAVNPEITKDANSYASVVGRLNDWELLPSEGYQPGWSGYEKLDYASSKELADEIKNERMLVMRNFSKLLMNPDYHEAFLTVQRINLLKDSEKYSAENMKFMDRARETLIRIESETGISIFSSSEW